LKLLERFIGKKKRGVIVPEWYHPVATSLHVILYLLYRAGMPSFHRLSILERAADHKCKIVAACQKKRQVWEAIFCEIKTQRTFAGCPLGLLWVRNICGSIRQAHPGVGRLLEKKNAVADF
jgi:hypothetical protein